MANEAPIRWPSQKYQLDRIMSIVLFHWLRFCGAVAALILAILYLAGYEQLSLIGFFLIGIYAAITCIRIQKGTQPAKCDLCGAGGILKVEYEHGYTNVRLILDCPHCGQVVNTAKTGVKPGLEKERSVSHLKK